MACERVEVHVQGDAREQRLGLRRAGQCGSLDGQDRVRGADLADHGRARGVGAELRQQGVAVVLGGPARVVSWSRLGDVGAAAHHDVETARTGDHGEPGRIATDRVGRHVDHQRRAEGLQVRELVDRRKLVVEHEVVEACEGVLADAGYGLSRHADVAQVAGRRVRVVVPAADVDQQVLVGEHGVVRVAQRPSEDGAGTTHGRGYMLAGLGGDGRQSAATGRRLTAGLDYYKPTMSQLQFERHPDAQVTFEFQNRNAGKPGGRLLEHLPVPELQARLDRFQAGFNDNEIDYLAGLERVDGSGKMFGPGVPRPPAGPPTPAGAGGRGRRRSAGVHDGGLADGHVLGDRGVERGDRAVLRACGVHDAKLDLGALYAEGDRRLGEKIALLQAHPEIKLAEFGTRHQFGDEWQRHVVMRLRDEAPENLIGTSNVAWAHKLGIAPIGSYAHEMDMVYAGLADRPGGDLRGSHSQMLDDWHALYGDNVSIALTDTFGSAFFFDALTTRQAEQWQGLRHDSGDPFDSERRRSPGTRRTDQRETEDAAVQRRAGSADDRAAARPLQGPCEARVRGGHQPDQRPRDAAVERGDEGDIGERGADGEAERRRRKAHRAGRQGGGVRGRVPRWPSGRATHGDERGSVVGRIGGGRCRQGGPTDGWGAVRCGQARARRTGAGDRRSGALRGAAHRGGDQGLQFRVSGSNAGWTTLTRPGAGWVIGD